MVGMPPIGDIPGEQIGALDGSGLGFKLGLEGSGLGLTDGLQDGAVLGFLVGTRVGDIVTGDIRELGGAVGPPGIELGV